MSESNTNRGGGSVVWGLAMLTTAVLFVLQVLGTIHVSYWVIFTPLLAALGLTIVGLVIALITFGGLYLALRRFDKKHAPSITPIRPRGYDR